MVDSVYLQVNSEGFRASFAETLFNKFNFIAYWYLSSALLLFGFFPFHFHLASQGENVIKHGDPPCWQYMTIKKYTPSLINEVFFIYVLKIWTKVKVAVSTTLTCVKELEIKVVVFTCLSENRIEFAGIYSESPKFLLTLIS